MKMKCQQFTAKLKMKCATKKGKHDAESSK